MNTTISRRIRWTMIGLSVLLYFVALGIYLVGMTQPDDLCILSTAACHDVPAAYSEREPRGCRVRATFISDGRFAKLVFADGQQLSVPGDQVLLVHSFPLKHPARQQKMLAGLMLLLSILSLVWPVRSICRVHH